MIRCPGLVVTIGSFWISQAAWALPPLQPVTGQPLADLSPAEMDRFFKGRDAFRKNFTAAQGLGPVFNLQSCAGCHSNTTGGPGQQIVTRFGTMASGDFSGLPELGGPVLQVNTIAIECKEHLPETAELVGIRITNSSFAFGLIEAIPEDLLIDLAENPPAALRDNPGRIHWVPSLEHPGEIRPGRFGWKAQVASILDFSADAAVTELGITNRLAPYEHAPNGDPDLLAKCDAVPDPEDAPDAEGFEFIDRIADFQSFLTAPPQTPRSGMTGEAIFVSIGCADCHIPTLTTSSDPELPAALCGKVIRPYTDLLLHDMGAMDEGMPQGDAQGYEWRTPPLWGLRIRNSLLHNGQGSGSFEIMTDVAITLHGEPGSSALHTKLAYDALSPAEREELIRFLDSLGRREFDMTGDGRVDEDDVPQLADCFSGPGNFFTPDDVCAIADIDQDGDFDVEEVALLLTVYAGPTTDCNGNGTLDAIDIITGTAVDTDADGFPDSCCPWDLDHDGMVGLEDLGILLAAVGPGTNPQGDINGNGDTDLSDLGALLSHYGDACSPR